MSSDEKNAAFLKMTSLIVLVVQNTSLVLLMRYSRTVEGPRYTSSTAVATMEIVKMCTALVAIFFENSRSWAKFVFRLKVEVWEKPLEIIKLAVPSLLYCIQNNLLYYALSNLDAAPYQVCYQIKILTTALFSVLMLKRKLSRLKWLALLMLTIGVALAQLSYHEGDQSEKAVEQNPLLGFIAVLLATVTSGFAGVYFELILKSSKVSLFVRNVQMGIPSISLAFATVFLSDRELVQQQGFFYGYNLIVAGVIILQATGGLIVAMVIRYADNLLKGFAAAISILSSCILEMIFFDFQPTFQFIAGAILVNFSVYLYGRTPVKQQKQQVLPMTTVSFSGGVANKGS
mmetsp:Transcript_20907/g.27123  ORF Transcript_20907/g.27123 Transcript_20907/m.27123 type:complete len:345 (+) Transcript_20907:106-1140(+)